MIALQLDMLAPVPAVPYRRESETSKAAAERLSLERMSDHEQQVYDSIRYQGPVSRKQLAARFAWADKQQNRITGRVWSLMRRNLVFELMEWKLVKGQRKYCKVTHDGSALLMATGVEP